MSQLDLLRCPGLEPQERPLQDKLTIEIDEDEAGRLLVTLFVPLDRDAPAEHVAIDLFRPVRDTLDIQYTVEMNLNAERNELVTRFADIYHNRRQPIGELLTGSALEPVPEDALRRAFMPIAAQGASTFRRLLQPDEEDTTIDGYGRKDASYIWAALRSALARAQPVAVRSPVRLFPWTFLYTGEALEETDLSTLDMTRFWGFQRPIQEEVEGMARRVRLPRPPQIVAAVSRDVDPDGEHAAGPLGRLAAERPDVVQWVYSSKELRDSLADFPGDCLYFYGHAMQRDPPTPTTSCLKLEGFEVTVDQIERAPGPRFRKDLVLAFLNGCETAPVNVWSRASLAGLLCLREKGRVCCVTTFAEVPIAFARRFGQLFWERFLGGATVGNALLQARRELLQSFNNPLGLLYSLFGRVETRLG